MMRKIIKKATIILLVSVVVMICILPTLKAKASTDKTTSLTDQKSDYYTVENLNEGTYILEDEKFYPFEITLPKQVVRISRREGEFFIRVPDMKDIDSLVPTLSKDTKLAYRGSTEGLEDHIYIKQILHTSYTYDLLMRGNNRFTDKFTYNGYKFLDFTFLNGEDIDFYDYCREYGYDEASTISAKEEGQPDPSPGFMEGIGTLMISPDITPETPLIVGYYDNGTDYKEQTIYPTIYYFTNKRLESEPFGVEAYGDYLVCERTKDGYFKYSFPENITSGYYYLKQGSANVGNERLIYIED